MELLYRLYGWPHEALHVLALLLIGRRPRAITRLHVDIPDDLTTGQYIFVAGLPALVFGIATAMGLMLLIRSQSFGESALGIAIMLIMGVGVAGTLSDLQQIILRLEQNAIKRYYFDDDTAHEKDTHD